MRVRQPIRRDTAMFAPFYQQATRFPRNVRRLFMKNLRKKIRREVAADFREQSFFADYEFSVSSEDSSGGGVV